MPISTVRVQMLSECMGNTTQPSAYDGNSLFHVQISNCNL